MTPISLTKVSNLHTSLDSNVRTIQTKSIQGHSKTFPTRTEVLEHMPIDSSFVKPHFQTNLDCVSTKLKEDEEGWMSLNQKGEKGHGDMHSEF